MSTNMNRVESHGCIVCGKIYNILVVYTPAKRLVDCTVTSPGGSLIPDAELPLVVCNHHSGDEIEKALAKHYPGKVQEEDFEEN